MEQNVKQKSVISGFPKMFADLSHQNQFLKMISFGLIVITLVSLSLVAVFVRSGPKVIALTPTGELAEYSDIVSEDHVKALAKHYLELRYSWDAKTLVKNLSRAEDLIADPMVPAFKKAMSDLLRFSKDKHVGQRVYARSINVDGKKGTVQILADRVTEIQGLKAATVLKLTLSYTVDERSFKNPWGVYVTKEIEEPL